MRLAARLVGALVLGIFVLLALDAYVSVQRETEQYRDDMIHDAQLLGDALKGLVYDIWRNRGSQQAQRLVRQANRHEQAVRIRWVSQATAFDSHPQLARDTFRHAEPVSFVAPDEQKLDRMYTYVAVSAADPDMGALELSEPMSVLVEHNRAIIDKTILLGTEVFAVSALAVGLLGVWLVGHPLRLLADKARRVGHGDLAGPLEQVGRGEMGELAQAMNEMCENLAESRRRVQQEQEERLKTLEQLRQADRLRTVGKLAAGVAHELGTPLNTIAIRATMIVEDSEVTSNSRRNATIVQQQTTRLSRIVQQLLAYARPRSLERIPTDLSAVLRETAEFLQPLAQSKGVTLHLPHVAEPMTAKANASQLQQVLINLVSNAIQAMPQGGEVNLELTRQRTQPPAGCEAKPGEYYCIAVRDQGEGISEKHMRHIFDPFFTTKDVGQGSGLGLSIALGIVQEHGGWLAAESQRSVGSCFRVYLPVAWSPSERSDPQLMSPGEPDSEGDAAGNQAE